MGARDSAIRPVVEEEGGQRISPVRTVPDRVVVEEEERMGMGRVEEEPEEPRGRVEEEGEEPPTGRTAGPVGAEGVERYSFTRHKTWQQEQNCRL